MKYLSDYVQDEQTKLFKRLWIFFAFGQNQFDEQKKDGVEYVWLGIGWMCCPKENAKEFLEQHEKLIKAGIQQDIKENWIEKIIERELINHEAYYTGDIEDTLNALSSYDVSYEQVKEVYKNTYEKNSENF